MCSGCPLHTRTPQHHTAPTCFPTYREEPAGGETLGSKSLRDSEGLVWGQTPATGGQIRLPSYGLLNKELRLWLVLKIKSY